MFTSALRSWFPLPRSIDSPGPLRVESGTGPAPKGLLLSLSPTYISGPCQCHSLPGVPSVHSVSSLLPIYLQECTPSSNYELNFGIMLDLKNHMGQHEMVSLHRVPIQEQAGLTGSFSRSSTTARYSSPTMAPTWTWRPPWQSSGMS